MGVIRQESFCHEQDWYLVRDPQRKTKRWTNLTESEIRMMSAKDLMAKTNKILKTFKNRKEISLAAKLDQRNPVSFHRPTQAPGNAEAPSLIL